MFIMAAFTAEARRGGAPTSRFPSLGRGKIERIWPCERETFSKRNRFATYFEIKTHRFSRMDEIECTRCVPREFSKGLKCLQAS